MSKNKVNTTITPEQEDAMAVEKALKKREAIAKAEKEKAEKELKEKLKEEEKANKSKVSEKDAVSATVMSSTGLVVRTYTEEHEGKGEASFVEKAKSYAEKIQGTVNLA